MHLFLTKRSGEHLVREHWPIYGVESTMSLLKCTKNTFQSDNRHMVVGRKP